MRRLLQSWDKYLSAKLTHPEAARGILETLDGHASHHIFDLLFYATFSNRILTVMRREGKDTEGFARMRAVNVLGVLRMTRAALPHLEKSNQARIINLAGTRGREPNTYSAVAGPINMGTLSLTKLMANDLGARNITVNAINPGSTNTRRWTNLVEVYAREKGIGKAEAEAHLLEEVPMRRIVEVRDISDLALFLASARAGMISGTAINVDGSRSRSI